MGEGGGVSGGSRTESLVRMEEVEEGGWRDGEVYSEREVSS